MKTRFPTCFRKPDFRILPKTRSQNSPKTRFQNSPQNPIFERILVLGIRATMKIIVVDMPIVFEICNMVTVT